MTILTHCKFMKNQMQVSAGFKPERMGMEPTLAYEMTFPALFTFSMWPIESGSSSLKNCSATSLDKNLPSVAAPILMPEGMETLKNSV